MEESHRKVLKKWRLKISRNINVRRVTESLFSGEILDENDREEILAETTTEYKALRLLDLLPRKGSQAFPEFLKALRGSGSGSGAGLANAIQSELSGEEPAGESNERRPRSVGLPRKVPKFVGRTDVCEEITHLLATDQGDDITCLVTIVAPPGFGKTAVATDIGYRMLAEGKDVLYFSLRNVCSLNRAAEDMLKKLAGVHAGENPVRQLTSYLSALPHQTVLILDNTEDLQIGDGPNFEGFLEETGQQALNVVTIITSRNAVSKLELFPFGTKHIPLKPLTGEDSCAYLRYHVPDRSDHLVRAFAKACRGVPLLLTITGSFLKKKTIDPIDLHRKLQNCPHSFLRGKDAKTQELYSLLQVFYNILGPDMKEYLAYLASFPTSFTKEEAKDVLFPNVDHNDFKLALHKLEQHSLVQQDEDQKKQYYSLHPLVQAFCKSSRKGTCTGYNTAIRQFSYHYLSLLQRLNDDFISRNCKTVIDKYHDRKTNISHAILASTEDDDIDLKKFGLRVSTEAVNFLAQVMKLDEFMSLYSQCLRVAEGMADKTLYSECLVSIGFKQLCYYGYKDAYRTDAKRSLQEAHDLQTRLVNFDSEFKGHSKCKLGLCCFVAGDKKKGISLIAQGIGMRKRLVHSEGSGKMERMLLAGGFCDLAMAMFTSGKYKAAVNIWTNLCLVRYRELLGTHPFTASLLHYIGDAYQKLGDPKRAVAFKKESLDMRRFLLGEEHLDTARAFYGVGCALGALGSSKEALEYLNRAYEIQKHFHASKYDIDQTEQEIKRFTKCTSKNKSGVATWPSPEETQEELHRALLSEQRQESSLVECQENLTSMADEHRALLSEQRQGPSPEETQEELHRASLSEQRQESSLVECQENLTSMADEHRALLSEQRQENESRKDTTMTPPTFNRNQSKVEGIVNHEGGVFFTEDVQVIFPNGAISKVDDDVVLKIFLEKPSAHCDMIVKNGLENEVMFIAPVLNLQPSGQVFEKPVTLQIKLSIETEAFCPSDVLVLHGSQATDGKIVWEDITDQSTIDLEKKELKVQIIGFSLIATLLRLTSIFAKDVINRLNLLGFYYTMSVLFKNNHPHSPLSELALVFMSHDVFHETRYREHPSSVLMQLKRNEYQTLRTIDRPESNRIYNNETLKVSLRLGQDYALTHGQLESNIEVDSSVWWSTGHLLQWSLKGTDGVRILCGEIGIEGQYGHILQETFCELDTYKYVREVLKVEGVIVNLAPFARELGVEKEKVIKVWQNDEDQLKIILLHWLKRQEEECCVDDPAILRNTIQGLDSEEFEVDERGKMHINHLRELAFKVESLNRDDPDLMEYFSDEITTLCNSILKDCCIELDAEVSVGNYPGFLSFHQQVSDDVALKLETICSSSTRSINEDFFSIAPFLVQAIKDIFRKEKNQSVVQNGLK